MTTGSHQTTKKIAQKIERGGERLWRFNDFQDLPMTAVAQTLSRLTRQGKLERLSKGIYYRSRQTTFGKSMPNPATFQKLLSKRNKAFPSGIAAANLLGFSTQMPRQKEIATNAPSLPRKLIGKDTTIHTRRPEAWIGLSEADAAMLDFLRRAGGTSELSPQETSRKTLSLLAEDECFERLLKTAHSEPPRVRALLGALGEQLGKKPAMLERLRDSLNPSSRFEFGQFSGLLHANKWYAKGRR
jgi:hypothetical protein